MGVADLAGAASDRLGLEPVHHRLDGGVGRLVVLREPLLDFPYGARAVGPEDVHDLEFERGEPGRRQEPISYVRSNFYYDYLRLATPQAGDQQPRVAAPPTVRLRCAAWRGMVPPSLSAYPGGWTMGSCGFPIACAWPRIAAQQPWARP